MAASVNHHRLCFLLFAVVAAALALAATTASATRSVPGAHDAAAIVVEDVDEAKHEVPSGESPIHNKNLPTPPADTANYYAMKHDVPSGESPVHNGLPTPPSGTDSTTVTVDRLVPTGPNPIHHH
uniref:Uncharacterized protein n=1 Tax=Leersia perrieri TaxID=77586 RepID=A0A0D9WFH8_9ORYZ